jgi:hypothetical protein
MKHIVSLESEYELIYANAAKYFGIAVDEILEIALAEYVVNLIPKKEKALN